MLTGIEESGRAFACVVSKSDKTKKKTSIAKNSSLTDLLLDFHCGPLLDFGNLSVFGPLNGIPTGDVVANLVVHFPEGGRVLLYFLLIIRFDVELVFFEWSHGSLGITVDAILFSQEVQPNSLLVHSQFHHAVSVLAGVGVRAQSAVEAGAHRCLELLVLESQLAGIMREFALVAEGALGSR